MVGTLGTAAERCELVTASGVNRPLSIKLRAVKILVMPTVVTPDTTSVISGAPPLYDTLTISSFSELAYMAPTSLVMFSELP